MKKLKAAWDKSIFRSPSDSILSDLRKKFFDLNKVFSQQRDVVPMFFARYF